MGVEGTGNPNVNAAALLERSYHGLKESLYAKMITQTHLKDLMKLATYQLDESNQKIYVDLAAITNAIQEQLSLDKESGKAMLREFTRVIRSYQIENEVGFDQYREAFASQSDELAWIIDSAGMYTTKGTVNGDTLYGINVDNAIAGLEGNDTIYGNEGNDVLHGGAGDDKLYGGNDHDTLYGGAGVDYLDGGYGNDTYIFGRGYGHDTIYDNDYTSGNVDTIKLGVTPEKIEVSRRGDDLVFTIKETKETLTIQSYYYGSIYMQHEELTSQSSCTP
ncbi:hypothetical protein B9L19_07745 [Geobacillus thermocatenulatus]|uniref:Uncharacterized protein n=1 Tax=Geobacillus thermocatenulatus TaxID=33938 RepID=A0A226QBN3_9BACL|nr:hypothetical protein GT3921_17660 [Geobacillus thermocatenulatus]KLR75100.1 hypothetical protein ABH20_02050 [Geobacillus sp. T6]OXB89901.1 hypothetical protein B9L19_07745 [Geobacillus thermocatenulatus]